MVIFGRIMGDTVYEQFTRGFHSGRSVDRIPKQAVAGHRETYHAGTAGTCGTENSSTSSFFLILASCSRAMVNLLLKSLSLDVVKDKLIN